MLALFGQVRPLGSWLKSSPQSGQIKFRRTRCFTMVRECFGFYLDRHARNQHRMRTTRPTPPRLLLLHPATARMVARLADMPRRLSPGSTSIHSSSEWARPPLTAGADLDRGDAEAHRDVRVGRGGFEAGH